jgi:hypothetical protein
MACLTAGGYNYRLNGGLAFPNNSQIIGSDAGPNPPGWRSGMDRGHLLARSLGGSGSDLRNLVSLYKTPNQIIMRAIEDQISEMVQGQGATVFYSATPSYNGANPIPTQVEINAWQITPQGPEPIDLPNDGIVPNTP